MGGRDDRVVLALDLATVFLVAAAALVVELVAIRLVAPYVGISLYSWTAVIAAVLAGLSAGHAMGGLLAREGVPLGPRLGTVLAAAALATLAIPPLLRLTVPILLGRDDLDVAWQVTLLALLLFAPPSLFAGAVSPLATRRALAAAPQRPGPVLGMVFAAGALGSILGTLLAGFLLVPELGSMRTLLAVAGLYGLLALAHLLGTPRALVTHLLPFVLLALVVLFVGATRAAYRSPCLRESAHFCIRVEDFTPLTGRPSRALVLDHLVHGINDLADPSLLYSPYLAAVDARVRAAFGERPLEVFHVGGGAYTLPRAWQGRGYRQWVAELDPAVTETAVARLGFAPDGIRILHGDGRRALATLPPEVRFEVVFVDAFRDIAVPAHLVTREFFGEVRRRLRPGGLLFLNVVDRRLRPRFVAALVRTLAAVFPVVELWLEEEEARADGEARVTWVVVATDRRFAPEGLDDRARTGLRFLRIDPTRLLREGAPLLTDDRAPVERLLAEILRRPELAE